MNKYISIIPNPYYYSLSSDYFSFSKDFSYLLKSVKYTQNNRYKNFNLEIPESYVLIIEKNQIEIIFHNKEGKFYAEQSLKQLWISSLDSKQIPCCTIYDKPEYSWRGFMLDCCRSFYSINFIKKILDVIALHKFNVFHWHLTDDQGWRFVVPEYPNLTTIGSKRQDITSPESEEGFSNPCDIKNKFYTDEQIKEIIDYASNLFITVVPEVELPGHSSALLASYPEFGCTGREYHVENRWGIFPDVLCAGNDSIFTLYDCIFKTISRLFPGKYIHIGGDECPTEKWDNCPKCQKRMKENNLSSTSELQSWLTSKMSELVIKYKKIPIGWDEVLENTEKIPLSKEIIVQSWRGFEGGEKALKQGHKVILSPVNHCYLNFKNCYSYEEPGRLGINTVQNAYSFNLFTKKMNEKSKNNILGGECNLWTEALPYSKTAEYLLFPRLCAISECLWLSEEKKDFSRFAENLNIHKKRLDFLGLNYYKGDLK